MHTASSDFATELSRVTPENKTISNNEFTLSYPFGASTSVTEKKLCPAGFSYLFRPKKKVEKGYSLPSRLDFQSSQRENIVPICLKKIEKPKLKIEKPKVIIEKWNMNIFMISCSTFKKEKTNNLKILLYNSCKLAPKFCIKTRHSKSGISRISRIAHANHNHFSARNHINFLIVLA